MIERVQEFWNRRPCNIRHSSKPVGTKEYFDEVEARKRFVEPHIPAFAQFARWKGKKVLEIGSGIGTDSISFARAGASITCVDLSEKSLEICKRRFQVYGLEGRFFHANAEELSRTVPVEQYDLVYSFGVIHHTPHPERVIAELHKYCHPDTELRVMLYAKRSWKVSWIVMKYGKGAFWRLNSLVRDRSEAESGCPVTYTYSRRQVQRLLAGFEVLQATRDHIFPYQIPKYINYEYRWNWYFRWIPAPMFRWLEQRLGWHYLIVAKPASSGR